MVRMSLMQIATGLILGGMLACDRRSLLEKSYKRMKAGELALLKNVITLRDLCYSTVTTD
jgi:hypothetical protein